MNIAGKELLAILLGPRVPRLAEALSHGVTTREGTSGSSGPLKREFPNARAPWGAVLWSWPVWLHRLSVLRDRPSCPGLHVDSMSLQHTVKPCAALLVQGTSCTSHVSLRAGRCGRIHLWLEMLSQVGLVLEGSFGRNESAIERRGSSKSCGRLRTLFAEARASYENTKALPLEKDSLAT